MSDKKKSTSEKETKPDAAGAIEIKGLGLIGSLVVLAVILLMGVVARNAIMFFVVGMAPTIVSIFMDKRGGNCASRTVGAFNFMGILPFLFQILTSTDKVSTASEISTNFTIWAIVYGAASMGWLMIYIIPQMTSAVFTVRANARIDQLTKAQLELIEEWGKEVADGTTEQIN